MAGYIIILWLSTIFTLIVGVLIGVYLRGQGIEQISSQLADTAKTIKKKLDTSPVGPVYRPTQQDLLDRANPKIAEGKREFGKLIKQIIKKDEQNTTTD